MGLGVILCFFIGLISELGPLFLLLLDVRLWMFMAFDLAR